MTELLDALFESSAAAVVVRDMDRRYLYANSRAQRLIRTERPLVGLTLDDVYAPERADELAQMDRNIVETGRPQLSEGKFILPNGEPRSIVVERNPVTLPGYPGRLVVAIAVAREGISSEPDEAEYRFRQLVNSIADIFILSSLDPPVIYFASPTVREVLGIEPDDLDLASFIAAIHADDRERVAATLADLGPNNPNCEVEYRVVQQDGSLRWLLGRTRFVSGPAGDQRLASVVNDVTADRSLRSELASARDEARDANARKDEFLSQMSHELRTPLHALLGFAQLIELEADLLSPDQLDSLRHVREAGQQLLDLINEILDLQRIERGVIRLTLEQVAIADVVREVVAMLEGQARDHNVTITVGDCGVLDAFVDRQRLRQVLINLVANAIKYNRVDGTVRVTWRRWTPGTARVEVVDSGMGIAESDLARLFDPFDRLDRSDDAEGTGIGLSISRKLVQAMGGMISVESRIGDGTTFFVDLPTSRPQATD